MPALARSSHVFREHDTPPPGAFTRGRAGRSSLAGRWLGGHWQDLMAVLAVAAALVVIGVYAA